MDGRLSVVSYTGTTGVGGAALLAVAGLTGGADTGTDSASSTMLTSSTASVSVWSSSARIASGVSSGSSGVLEKTTTSLSFRLKLGEPFLSRSSGLTASVFPTLSMADGAPDVLSGVMLTDGVVTCVRLVLLLLTLSGWGADGTAAAAEWCDETFERDAADFEFKDTFGASGMLGDGAALDWTEGSLDCTGVARAFELAGEVNLVVKLFGGAGTRGMSFGVGAFSSPGADGSLRCGVDGNTLPMTILEFTEDSGAPVAGLPVNRRVWEASSMEWGVS
ncbi:hypothetical protein AGDE_12973 [Angomonas deanei]|nr:hypothetical protein AGDE_12973 [Angomonas deanei]|eukprot:EPY23153.1 hypothetical protein AGDE_12973 [Angomonas deanei]